MPQLARITLYPVKALPGVEVATATIAPSGALLHDREYALVDAHGKYFNGKLRPEIHRLDVACAIEGNAARVTLQHDARKGTFILGDDNAQLEAWLAQYFGEPIRIKRNCDAGFPDDTKRPGPTVIAGASFTQVANWYAGQTTHDMRRRFRANLEFDDCPAFWEDRLFGEPGVEVAFRIGNVRFIGMNPCERCIVPTRDPATGDALPGFQRTFVDQRKATLPAWATRSRFAFYYRLSVNTRVESDQARKIIRVGDDVELI